MSDFRIDPLQPRNMSTYLRHRKEVFWQITIPLVIGVVFVLLLAVLTILLPAGKASTWADISIIWLITPMLIFGLIFGVILAALIYLVVRLIQELPFIAFRVQNGLRLTGMRLRKVDNAAVEPFLRWAAFRASLHGFMRSLRWK